MTECRAFRTAKFIIFSSIVQPMSLSIVDSYNINKYKISFPNLATHNTDKLTQERNSLIDSHIIHSPFLMKLASKK